MKRTDRKQYAALPLAEKDGQPAVMLVTSRETRRWVIPKGWAEAGLKPHALAAKEAYEEAGLVGKIGHRPVGTFRYGKRLGSGRSVTCEVEVFPLTVERELDDWPEKNERERCWFTPAEAALLVEEVALASLLLGLANGARAADRKPPSKKAGDNSTGGKLLLKPV